MSGSSITESAMLNRFVTLILERAFHMLATAAEGETRRIQLFICSLSPPKNYFFVRVLCVIFENIFCPMTH